MDTDLTLKEFLAIKHFDFQAIEEQIRTYWEEKEIYKFDFESGKKPILIDTPPPYANGALHHGHSMSYTQLDIIARFHRMRWPTLLPLAFDDNGLPTERYTEKKYNIEPGQHPDNFFELCKIEAMKGIETQIDQFKRFGFSFHPEVAYRTIDDRTTRITQKDFIDLYNSGKIYRSNEPQLYCTHCQTALAQADLEIIENKTEMHIIEFPSINENDSILIGTTRPELIPAAVAIFYHPEDQSHDYQNLKIINPWNNNSIPILPDENVDLNTGTGILMCSTFGDQLDIELYRKHNLPNKNIINSSGLIQSEGMRGLSIKDARLKIIKYLKEKNYWKSKTEIKQQIPTCERCNTPMEIIESEQWIMDLMSSKNEFLKYIQQIKFHPDYMKKRLINWIKGLKWNWILSRQRYYGISIPAWHCQDCGNITIAKENELPLFKAQMKTKKCSNCGSLAEPDPDIFDTWMSSSLTPRILKDRFFNESFEEPLTLRSQAHEIIRTWAFYTLYKQFLSGRKQVIPWNHLLISGWGLGFKGKGKRGIKASKSSGSGKNPNDLITEYSADALRYWAASARLGKDQYLMEATLNRGKKIQTKLFNAAKITFILINQIQTIDNQDQAPLEMKITIQELIEFYEGQMKKFNYTDALAELEQQFWETFCSKQIENLKTKGYQIGLSEDEKSNLLFAWKQYLKLFAPFFPFITEYLWFVTSLFSNEKFTKYQSIHQIHNIS